MLCVVEGNVYIMIRIGTVCQYAVHNAVFSINGCLHTKAVTMETTSSGLSKVLKNMFFSIITYSVLLFHNSEAQLLVAG